MKIPTALRTVPWLPAMLKGATLKALACFCASIALFSASLHNQQAPKAPGLQGSRSPVQFTSIAEQSGLKVRVVNGGETTKRYVFESTGSGVALSITTATATPTSSW